MHDYLPGSETSSKIFFESAGQQGEVIPTWPKWTLRAAHLEPVKVDENRTVMAGLNLIMRPHDTPNIKFVQLGDLTDVERVKNVAFMIIQTSPGNHQAWLAVEGANPDLVRRLRKGTGADQTASGATRVAGTQNFKVRNTRAITR